MNHYVFVDCNEFYVACERLFNPSIETLPVIILSTDGSRVIALSQEANSLGIKVGDAYFKIKAYCNRMQVVIFSANEKLYGDVSHRVMNLLSSVAEEIEVHSMNEACLKFSSRTTPENIFSTCNEIREKIKKWVGISLSIGIAPTKTLAKIANKIASKNASAGICQLSSPLAQKQALEIYPIYDIPEISSRVKEHLKIMEISSAWEFSQMDPSLIRRIMGGTSEQLVWELRGIDRALETTPAPKTCISMTKTYENGIPDSRELAETLSSFMRGASDQLKAQQSCAKTLFVNLESVLDENHCSSSHVSISLPFSCPTNDPAQMIMTAKQCLNKLYASTERYTKCEVELLDLISEELVQKCSAAASLPKRRKLSDSVDDLNAFYRKSTLHYGAMETLRSWKTATDPGSQQRVGWKGLAFALAK